MIQNLIIGLAFMILGYVLMPRPKMPKPPAVSEMDGPTSEAGRDIPVLFGDQIIRDPNYLWWGDKTYVEKVSLEGKKKS